jgi:hypothetical protein
VYNCIKRSHLLSLLEPSLPRGAVKVFLRIMCRTIRVIGRMYENNREHFGEQSKRIIGN